MIPSQSDIQKRKTNADKLRKKITQSGKLLEKELVRIVRKAVDSAWMTAAHKLVFLEDRVIPDMNESTRTKWLIKCDHCGNLFKLCDVQVDHIIGEFPCTSPDDFHAYIMNRVNVEFKDLQILCKEDHLNKTYAERHGLSLEEAKCTREAIRIQKEKKDVEWLKERGYTPASNKDKRREQIKQKLMEEQGAAK